MSSGSDSAETVLIVDDEDSVRKTFREWLEGARLGCTVLTAADAESALRLADQHTVDLAVLDWNLGAGSSDGLHLLEDLREFNEHVVAIMVTGYAHQATPLHAMRMGVRDYLDKNQDLSRDNFLAALRKQLADIRPAKRERRLHRSLAEFRDAVGKVLPLVQAASALQDPVPLPAAVRSLFAFLLRTTGARDGVLLVRGYDPDRDPAEVTRAYDTRGVALEADLVPFARSIAGSVVSVGEPCAMERPEQSATGGALDLQPFERGRRTLLAAPLSVGPATQVVLELFDKQPAGPFTEADRHLVGAAADFGAEMIRQALAERQTHQVLFDAVEAALGAGDAVARTLQDGPAPRPEEPPPPAVLEQLRAGLSENPSAPVDAEETLRLAEAIRVLAVRYGPPAVEHCIRLVENLRGLLDRVTDQVSGDGEARP